MLRFPLTLLLVMLVLLTTAEKKPKSTATPKLLELLSPKTTGIKWNGFARACDTNADGGVGIGDVNNDGLMDIYFTGDSFSTLYINKGNFKFEELAHKKGAFYNGAAKGVLIYDLDGDGFNDILLTYEHDFTDVFYECINKKGGIDSATCMQYLLKNNCLRFLKNNGNLTFTDITNSTGLLANGSYYRSALIDYNRDGLPDIYVGAFYHSTNDFALKYFDEASRKYFIPNHLFKNLGNGHFVDVIDSMPKEMKYPGHLNFSICVNDLNMDGWPDLYIGNDWDFADYLFINDKGTFKNQLSSAMGHTTFYTMGIDVADLNNDGLPDIINTDMRPSGNFRQKNNWSEISYDWDQILRDKSYQAQKVQNTLQLNRGQGKFSEIGELLGIDATEWSWGDLMVDLDNDGLKDIYIANGNIISSQAESSFPLMIDSLRSIDPKLNNLMGFLASDCHRNNIGKYFVDFVYKNEGNLKFTDMSAAWGIDTPSNSNGVAYADLDNDGDLDLVIVNNKSRPFIYRNNADKLNGNNYLRIKLHDNSKASVLNTKVWIYVDGAIQYSELQPVRSYLAYCEDLIHFGLGKHDKVDSLRIVWPDQHEEIFYNVKSNQVLNLTKNAANTKVYKPAKATPLMQPANDIAFVHKENKFVDFGLDPLLPRKYSQMGPGVCVADLNGDDLEDVVVGGAKGENAAMFLQRNDGSFEKHDDIIKNDADADDATILAFDVNNDGKNDLLVTKGGYEFMDSAKEYAPSLYINNGTGIFTRSAQLAEAKTSSTTAAAADFDNDGYMDLFIGGRVCAQGYPASPNSYLYKNDHGTFTDVTDKVAPQLRKAGMVSAALWSDYNNDGKKDLVLVGEYMPITFFKNTGTGLVNVTGSMKFNQKMNGLWNSIIGGDFNNDGKIDYLVGNLGQNTRYKGTQTGPLQMYAEDFDDNGSVDLISTYYENGKCYPTKLLKTLTPRINGLAKKYYKQTPFGNATIQDMFGADKVKDALCLSAYELSTGILWNRGNDSFEFKPLPVEAQFAPVYGTQVYDVDDDGNLDLVLSGNFFNSEVEIGKYDAFYGLVLKGMGNENFKPLSIDESGLLAGGDCKGLATLNENNRSLFLVCQNNDSLKTFQLHATAEIVQPPAGASWCEIKLANGQTRRHEIYTGSGYMSQSSRRIRKGRSVKEVVFHDSRL